MLLKESLTAVDQEWSTTDRNYCLLHAAVCGFFLIVNILTAFTVAAPGTYISAAGTVLMASLLVWDLSTIRFRQVEYCPRYALEIVESLIMPAQGALMLAVLWLSTPLFPAAYGVLAVMCIMVWMVFNIF